LNTSGVETEIFYIGKKPIRGCTACAKCLELNKCVFDDDAVNVALEKADKSDGFISVLRSIMPELPVLSHHFWTAVFSPTAMFFLQTGRGHRQLPAGRRHGGL